MSPVERSILRDHYRLVKLVKCWRAIARRRFRDGFKHAISVAETIEREQEMRANYHAADD